MTCLARRAARSPARWRGAGANPAPTDTDAVLAYLREHAPPLHDPFAGGGSIPLEAQRLGLRAIASDLNPLAVLINKALIELPPKFRDQPPVNPEADRMGMTIGKGRKARQVAWRGAAGLADDIRYYGRWMRDEAYRQIGHLYPKVRLPDGGKATVIAWLWARTIPCPNPACGVRMPLMRTFQLSTKKGNQHWTRPLIDRRAKTIEFVVQDHPEGVPQGETVSRKGAICLACRSAAPLTYVREQARVGELREQMTAIVAEGKRQRLFLSPDGMDIKAAIGAESRWRPLGDLPEHNTKAISLRSYGLTQWSELFTERQLTGLTTLSGLLAEVFNHVAKDSRGEPYTTVVCTYLALAIGRAAASGCSFSRWQNTGDFVAGVFSRQAISMVWDFAETNLFSTSSQNWMAQVDWVSQVIERLPDDADISNVYQADATVTGYSQNAPIIVTDPPYYDNIFYADVADFFYVWLRPLLRNSYPDLFAGILTPKSDEMVAHPKRFEETRHRFDDLLRKALERMRECGSSDFPISIFFAYKQQDELREGRASTGWETMLNAAISAGFQIVGTWPMRTERPGRTRAIGSNALASSVVLVCRPRPGQRADSYSPPVS